MLRGFCCSLVLLGVCAPAYSYDAGLSVGGLSYSSECCDGSASSLGVSGFLSFPISRYLSLRSGAGFGLGSGDVGFAGEAVDVSVDSYFTAYLKGGYRFGDGWEVYALGGYGRVSVSASFSGVSGSDSEGGLSGGFGLARNVGEGSVFGEYVTLYHDDDFFVGGLSFGYRWEL